MRKITLTPHTGASIHGYGNIYFGQSKEGVIAILGEPTRKHIGRNTPDTERFMYNDIELSIYFTDGKVDFIEYVGGPFCEKTKPVIYEKKALSLLAEDLIAILSEKNNGEIKWVHS